MDVGGRRKKGKLDGGKEDGERGEHKNKSREKYFTRKGKITTHTHTCKENIKCVQVNGRE
jgi:hypothetical protein